MNYNGKVGEWEVYILSSEAVNSLYLSISCFTLAVCRCHHHPPLKLHCPFLPHYSSNPPYIFHFNSTISITHSHFNLRLTSKFKQQYHYGSLTILESFRRRITVRDSGEDRHVDIVHEGNPSFHSSRRRDPFPVIGGFFRPKLHRVTGMPRNPVNDLHGGVQKPDTNTPVRLRLLPHQTGMLRVLD